MYFVYLNSQIDSAARPAGEDGRLFINQCGNASDHVSRHGLCLLFVPQVAVEQGFKSVHSACEHLKYC